MSTKFLFFLYYFLIIVFMFQNCTGFLIKPKIYMVDTPTQLERQMINDFTYISQNNWKYVAPSMYAIDGQDKKKEPNETNTFKNNKLYSAIYTRISILDVINKYIDETIIREDVNGYLITDDGFNKMKNKNKQEKIIELIREENNARKIIFDFYAQKNSNMTNDQIGILFHKLRIKNKL